MKQEFITKTAYTAAYERWFSEYHRERRRQGKRTGARLANFPDAPPNPEEIAARIDAIGTRRALAMLGIHRSTLARWLAGRSVMPRPAWLLLVMLADGRLPGMSDDWQQFRFDGDRLHQIGTRLSYSAREIAGWQFQQAHSAALARRVVELEKQIGRLLLIGTFDAANAPIYAV